jgi:class 3 adenylate cyclase/tetratricopeptide (TPR) repeat protein
MDIASWLQHLGVGQYAQAFREHDIDAEVLLRLTAEDIAAIGVTSIGHRRKLLDAIAALATKNSVGEISASSDLHPQLRSSRTAERRQLTVIFVDLVGSTELSQRLDPEDLRDAMRHYQDAVAGCITRYGGYVAKFLGDGVLAYFGWPQDFEDQAERAVHAGLAAIRAIEAVMLNDSTTLRGRIGIATGQVVVGDLIGATTLEAEAVTGQTPNLAARLQAVARPGEVVIGGSTRRLIGTMFKLEDLGSQNLKSFPEPVHIWCVRGESETQERFVAAHTQTLTPLVGREPELRLLQERWALTMGGEGQVLLVSGEAGIGKSRLVRELREHIRNERHFYIPHQCSPHHINTALHPLIRSLEQSAGFAVDDTIETKLDKLEAWLKLPTPNGDSIAPLLANLLSVPSEGRYGFLDLTPQQRRDRSIQALVGQVLALSRQWPVLFVLEDAHWIDSTTDLLIAELIPRIARAAVLVLITHRLDYVSPWTGHLHLTSMTLNRLSRNRGREIVQSVVSEELTEGVIDRIITRADGVPLYIEELSKSLLENPTRADDETIPETLRASMTARLDRLGTAKHVAQVGSVIGGEFSYPLIVSVSGVSEEDTLAGLSQMVRSGLVYQHGTPPAASYQFKHVLVQDAAYESLLRRQRQLLHARIAALLEETFSETVESEPELLAHHWEHGQEIERALHYRLMAARKADKLCAPWEAVTHYLRSLKLLEQLPETADRRREFLQIVLSLTSVRGDYWRNDTEMREARRIAEKALAVAREMGDVSAVARLQAFEGNYWKGEQLLAAALADAEVSGSDRVQADVASYNANYLGFVGRFDQALAHTKRVIQIYEQLGDRSHLGVVLAGSARCWSARAGLLEESLQYANAARRLSSEIADLELKAWLPMEAEPLLYKGLWQRTVEVAEEGLPIAREIAQGFVVPFISAWAAIAYLKLNRVKDARRIVDEALKSSAGRESQGKTYAKIALSQILLAEGQFDEACRIGQEALEECDRGGLRLEQGFAYRTLGQAHAAAGNAPAADTWFRRSLELTGDIHSQPELAQTMLAYGRFQRERNPEEGVRLLRRALTLFEAMGASGWTEETREALGEVSPIRQAS